MMIEKFARAVVFAAVHDLDASDLVILYDVGTAPDGEATIMKIVSKKPSTMSKATRHDRVLDLCKRGFLIKKEVPKNMRKKSLELSNTAMEFIKLLEEIDV